MFLPTKSHCRCAVKYWPVTWKTGNGNSPGRWRPASLLAVPGGHRGGSGHALMTLLGERGALGSRRHGAPAKNFFFS
jgi:hypothetical protein